MSIESKVISQVEHTVAGAAGSVVGTAVSAANPLTAVFGWLKVAGYVAASALAAFLVWKVVSFVEQAAADHAAVQVVTAQLATATKANADNLAAANTAAAEHEAVIVAANAAAAAARTRAAQLAADLETRRHAPHPTICRPGVASPLLDRLR